jgi:two-component system, OmpR family, phosphate regulon sensor histidine kinase PhoR
MHYSWRQDVWFLLGLVMLALLLGVILGHPYKAVIIALALYLAPNLRHLLQLHRWLETQQREDIPEASGMWGDVFDRIRTLTKESKQREDQLTNMLARFQSANAATPDAMIILTENDQIEWANPAAEYQFGIAHPRDHGLRLLNLVRSPDFTAYLHKGDYTDVIDMTSPRDLEKTLSVQIIPFGSSQKLMIGRDVTRLVNLEKMRRDFVANISHELRTPLTVVTGYIETLQDIPNLDEKDLKKHLVAMHDQAVRMQRLVDDLLTLSKLETAPPLHHETAVDIPAMLAGLKETAELLSGERRHRITLEAAPGLQLLGNEDELRSALSNLITNAVRYTPAQASIHLLWQRTEDGARFSVTDSGEGIAPHHLAHLTERFYRIDSARSRATGGTGLGLSIVKHILLRHNARLVIESELGTGSTFSCVFPAARVQNMGATGALRAASGNAGS